MGQKIHPVGLRLGITRTWDSRWFEKKHYIDWLHEDVAIRKFFTKWQRSAGISKIEIERRTNQARVIINTAKPGIIIGKRGVGIEDIRKSLEKLTGKQVQVNVMEIKHPEIDARLIGQNIVDQLEKRIAFRRAMKQAIMRTMKAGAQGVKVQVSGRLGGAEIARTERNKDGKVPLHTLRADIDYADVEAFTTFGRIGVKVWVYRGEVLPDQPRNENRLDRGERSGGGFRERRERGGRGGRGRTGAPGNESQVAMGEPTAQPSVAPFEPAFATAIAAPEPVAQAIVASFEAIAEPVVASFEPTAEPVVASFEPTAEPVVASFEPTAEPVVASFEPTTEPVVAVPEPIAADEPAAQAQAAPAVEPEPPEVTP
ncbi:MAG TPA: 30S ribosomal protein S3 [Verrucomicrobiae bacterium]|jgi:small subunit ribosomal protein S3|nr:30S ribosomal protein S3 [Verrucomicrobiae bacterium]